MKTGDLVQFSHYGARQSGVVLSVRGSVAFVWKDSTGKRAWLHVESCTKIAEPDWEQILGVQRHGN